MPRTHGHIWIVCSPAGIPKAVFTVKHEMFAWLRGLRVAAENRVFKCKDAGGQVEFVTTVGVLLGSNNPGKDD